MALSEEQERARVEALHGYDLVDREPLPQLQALVRLAGYVCGTPLAAVNLIDADRQVQAAALGFPPGQCSRSDSPCHHVVEAGKTVYLPDARTDPRFADSPFVTGVLGSVRLYASVPLVTPQGQAIGTLCVLDPRPRSLSCEQLERLGDLADQTMAQLELRRTAIELTRLATHDALTGLPNRRLLVDRAQRALSRSARSGQSVLAVLLDIDGFKQVNDLCGHKVGDALLVEVARRLETVVRAEDTVARLSGDEFVVLCEGAAEPVLARLHGAFREPFQVRGGPLPARASIGAAWSGPGEDLTHLLRRADLAMYVDKGRNTALPRPRGVA